MHAPASEPTKPDSSSGRPPRRWRWLVLALALAAGLATPELALRWMLFEDSERAQRVGERLALRRPELFGDPTFDSEYWVLRRRLAATRAEREAQPPIFDALLGWRTSAIQADYDHDARARLAGRRPLLLYGASYCDTDFDAVFERSDLAQRWGLVNYCIGGVGPDQVLLLLRESLKHFDGLSPVVALGLEVNGDFDRAVLSYRSFPKPRATVRADGTLEFSGPVASTLEEHIARHPLAISSYALRALGEHWLGETARAERERARQELKWSVVSSIVAAIDDELERRGIPYFYVLFNDVHDCATDEPRSWIEPRLVELLERESISYQLARPVLRRASREFGEPLASYFVHAPHPREGHPSEVGLERLLECFRAGLAPLN